MGAGGVPIMTNRKGWRCGHWLGCAEHSDWRAAAGSGRGAAEGPRPWRSLATWQAEGVKAEPEARGKWRQEASSRSGEGGSPQTPGNQVCLDLRDHPDCSTPSLRTERDTYRNLSSTSPGCLASRGLGELECRRVKVRPAPSSLSLAGMGEPLGGPRNVSVRGCP